MEKRFVWEVKHKVTKKNNVGLRLPMMGGKRWKR